MKIDIVTIFPAFFDVLDVSLIGKALDKNLVEISVHDLRDATTDPHRSVDDTPYGGGAGMVMSPEPWGVVLDRLLTTDSVLVVPSPAGRLFTQAQAKELAQAGHLVFACGRYEGIDQRVIEHYSQSHTVLELSLGDYVLNGGEVAVVAMVEATLRLVPGVIGNPESLIEESHEEGLVEYPSYTKPRTWRGIEVPEVLLSGHHEQIRQWRHEQSVARTQRMRPDLLSD
ncbi:MAG: tRNA (guanosine(37)-N1)-methyltransferase TrmD [Pontimonas sp.]|nr:MAG: tRNA (guanine-N1)-methyltransferase [actinobacterium acMicro-4]MCF8522238.1 tRNA (guanosine(37)-N1)-methyltransferase TrmD [Pontimonas sp.]MCF8548029.1 tRNA (guanosine(37)-N1)-methyltransferase TrmD [Pontimonas sp.]